ncbi:hypothetical protein [Bifidobacterium margollesii]|uniref:hypothetical protein n=1 Tax=Bifidobacterium margollesii TaxID=2020964 RepID=UPI001FAF8A4B|nr:hypothetical protein [Bifidobacterium margollesii]
MRADDGRIAVGISDIAELSLSYAVAMPWKILRAVTCWTLASVIVENMNGVAAYCRAPGEFDAAERERRQTGVDHVMMNDAASDMIATPLEFRGLTANE